MNHEELEKNIFDFFRKEEDLPEQPRINLNRDAAKIKRERHNYHKHKTEARIFLKNPLRVHEAYSHLEPRQLLKELRILTWNVDTLVGHTLAATRLLRDKRIHVGMLQDTRTLSGAEIGSARQFRSGGYVFISTRIKSGHSLTTAVMCGIDVAGVLVGDAFMSVVLDLKGSYLCLVNYYMTVWSAGAEKEKLVTEQWAALSKFCRDSQMPGKPTIWVCGGDANAQVGQDAHLSPEERGKAVGSNLYHKKSNFPGRIMRNFLNNNDFSLVSSKRSSRISKPIPTFFGSEQSKSQIDHFFCTADYEKCIGSVKTKEGPGWQFKPKHSHRAVVCSIKIDQIRRELVADHTFILHKGPVQVCYDKEKLVFFSKLLRKQMGEKIDEDSENQGGNDTLDLLHEEEDEEDRPENRKEDTNLLEKVGNVDEIRVGIANALAFYKEAKVQIAEKADDWEFVQGKILDLLKVYFPLSKKVKKRKKFETPGELILRQASQHISTGLNEARHVISKARQYLYFDTWKSAVAILKSQKIRNNAGEPRYLARIEEFPNSLPRATRYENVWIVVHDWVLTRWHQTKRQMIAITRDMQQFKKRRDEELRPALEALQATSKQRFFDYLLRPAQNARNYKRKMAAIWSVSKILRGKTKQMSAGVKELPIWDDEKKQYAWDGESQTEAFSVFLRSLLQEHDPQLIMSPEKFEELDWKTEEQLDTLPDRTRKVISKHLWKSLNTDFTTAEIVEGIRRGKWNKAIGLGGLAMDVIKAFPTWWASILEPFFNDPRGIPLSWMIGWVCHLYKNKGKFEIPENHRTVVILESPYKCWASCMTSRFESVVEQIGGTHQAGNQRNQGCQDNLAVNAAWLTRSSGAGKTCVFLDLSKAFDKTIRGTLIECCKDFGLPKNFVWRLYNGLSATALRSFWNSTLGPRVEITKGVMQGSPLSPVTFLVYTEKWHAKVIDAVKEEEDNVLNLYQPHEKMEVLTDQPVDYPIITIPEARWNKFNAEQKTENTQRDRLALLSGYVDDTELLANALRSAAAAVKAAEEQGRPQHLFTNKSKTVVITPEELTNQDKEWFMTTIGLTRANTPKWEETKSAMFQINTRILGSYVSAKLSDWTTVAVRLDFAKLAWKRMSNVLMDNKRITMKAKSIVFLQVVLSTLLYGIDRQMVADNVLNTMQSFLNGCALRIYEKHHDIVHDRNDDEGDCKRDVKSAAREVGLPDISSYISAADLCYWHRVATRKKINLATLFAMRKTRAETENRPKFTSGMKAGKAQNIDPLGANAHRSLRVCGENLLTRCNIFLEVANTPEEHVCELLIDVPTENEDQNMSVGKRRNIKIDAGRYRTYVNRCHEADLLLPKKKPASDADEEALGRSWSKLSWLALAKEGFYEAEVPNPKYKFMQVILQGYADAINIPGEESDFHSPWPKHWKEIAKQTIKAAVSANSTAKSQRLDRCGACGQAVKGIQGLGKHLATAKKKIDEGWASNQDRACCDHYAQAYPAVELTDQQMRGKRKAGRGDPNAAEEWKQEPWRFKCPLVNNDEIKNCDFPQDGLRTTWCIFCRLRENYSPRGCTTQKEYAAEYQEKKREHKKKTGKTYLPNQKNQNAEQLQKSACQFGNRNCAFPVKDEKQNWCIFCKTIGPKESNPEEQQAPEAHH